MNSCEYTVEEVTMVMGRWAAPKLLLWFFVVLIRGRMEVRIEKLSINGRQVSLESSKCQ